MERGKGFFKLLPWMLSFVLLWTVLAVKYFMPETPVWQPPEPEPLLKLAASYEPVSPRRIYHRTRVDAGVLCDGDETTIFTTDTISELTLDLGKVHMLGGIRILPAGETQAILDRCQGLTVSVSKDNRRFQKAATLEPVDHIGYRAEWKEVAFGGAGEFRYVRLTVPAKAQIAEVSCLGYPEWSFRSGRKAGETNLNLRLYAYDAQKETEARILTGAFNERGVLKALSVTEQAVLPQEDCTLDVKLSVPNHGIGDRYRVMAWDRAGNSLLLQDLNFRYTQGGMAFSVPNLFSDAMMLQAEKPVRIWGNAPKGSKVTVTLQDETGAATIKEAMADADSAWMTELGSFPYGGTYTLRIACGEETKEFQKITFGDVWLCVGQSNMEYHMLGGEDTQRYILSAQGKKEANNPNLRLLNLWSKGAYGSGLEVANLPVGYRNPAWSKMNPDAAAYCSAVGYFFANRIYQEFGVPVGLITAAVGDTEINRWLPYGKRFGTFQGSDGSMYYSRILPLKNLAVRGILMYQGEADEYRTHLSTEEYRDAFCGLVDLYRSIWGEDLPFYWTQLTRYGKDESLIREGQRMALSGVNNQANIGMVSLLDIYGEFDGGAGNCREDIHPHQKQVVAERFSRYAARDVYGGSLPASGPVYQSARRIENKLELTFLATGSLQVMDKAQYADAQGQRWIKETGMDETVLQEFEVAGADGIFYPAHAEIQGNTLLVWSPQVLKPVQARYGWGAYPEMPNLTDESLLPSASFMTEMVTI